MKLYFPKPDPLNVEAILWDGEESTANEIVTWIESVRGRGAACWTGGDFLFAFIEGFEHVFAVPAGWYIYRREYSDRFHALPASNFERKHEEKP